MKKTLLAMSVMGAVISPFAQSGNLYLQGDLSPYSKTNLNMNNTSTHSKRLPFRITAGYQFYASDNWGLGIETGYMNWNKLKGHLPFSHDDYDASWKVKQNAWDALFVADYNIANGFHVFAKGGLAFIRQTNKLTESDFWEIDTYQDKVSKVLPDGELGVGYKVNDNVDITASVNHIFGRTVSENHPRAISSSTNLMLGLKVLF